jgi:glycerophosphoryl diester phosphodiesterase
VRGSGRRVALLFAGWHGTIAVLSIVLLAVFRPLAARMLEGAGSTRSAVLTIVTLLALHGLGTAAGSFLAAVGHALITLHVYRELHPERPAGALARPADGGAPADLLARAGAAIASRAPWTSGAPALCAAVVILLAAFVVPACVLVSRLGGMEKIEITAHRGASRAAPENTLSAVRAAIEGGADWAEIDVQETSDGRVLVLHDQDLMRLAGDPRRIADLTFEEARKIDVGVKFDPRFAGEKLPTLEEVIDLSRGKIRLNIELKYYGKGDPRLAPDVARILRDAKFGDQCFVASLDYGSLAEARKEWPALQTAAIVTVRVGDPTRLDVDMLSMSAKLVNSAFVRAAHLRGKEVLVWTIDDPKLATRLADLGVDNLITNDPAPMARLRDERAALTRVERMVLGFRVLLGGSVDEPAAGVDVPML